ncbi:expressed protein [Phakopsora pachyrhizi]|uniref:Expressed protein n=1 Tax=Phakopsora pachyrhizi TaxID=170000 RepID=A0AAV0AWC1_PHAPC|nr:expressed protein [Phakopsora pachyrhizi]
MSRATPKQNDKLRSQEIPVLRMPSSWVYLIDDGSDDSFEGMLSLIELFSSRTMLPVASHVLQLIGLVLNSSCSLRSHTLNFHQDPTVHTAARVASRAMSILRSLIQTCGPGTVLCCLPGHKSNSESDPSHMADLEATKSTKNLDCGENLVLKRLTSASNVWEILSANLETASSTSSNLGKLAIIRLGGWDLLELLVQAWELDSEKQRSTKRTLGGTVTQASNSIDAISFSPHLLRQFSLLSFGGRRIDPRVLDIIFEPFSQRASEEKSYPWGNSINSADRARKLALRLLSLLQDLDSNGLFDLGRLRQDTVIKMRMLQTDSFNLFVDMLPFERKKYNAQLLLLYLEAVTRPSNSTDLKPLKDTSKQGKSNGSNGSLSSFLSVNKSGLRRNLSQNSLVLDQQGQIKSSSSNFNEFPTAAYIVEKIFSRLLTEIPNSEKNESSKVDVEVIAVEDEEEEEEELKRMKLKADIIEADLRYTNVLNKLINLLDKIYDENGKKTDETETKDWMKAIVNCEIEGHEKNKLRNVLIGTNRKTIINYSNKFSVQNGSKNKRNDKGTNGGTLNELSSEDDLGLKEKRPTRIEELQDLETELNYSRLKLDRTLNCLEIKYCQKKITI